MLAGNYTVNWTATPDDENTAATTVPTSSGRTAGFVHEGLLVNEILHDASPKSGTTQLHDLEATSYYVDVNSGCGWSFTFSPGT